MKTLFMNYYSKYLIIGIASIIFFFIAFKVIDFGTIRNDPESTSLIPLDKTGRVHGKIAYDPDWAYQNDASNNNFEPWFDGVITNSTPGSPTSSELKNFLDPTRTYFTFPEELNLHLETIRLYDGEGTTDKPIRILLLLTTGEEVEGIVPDFTGSKYQEWHEHKIPEKFQNVKAVIFEKHKGGLYPDEIEFLGEHAIYNPSYPPIERVKLKNMYGINSFPWNNSGKLSYNDPDTKDLLSRYNNMGWNRAYDDWPLFDDGSGVYRFSPTYTGGWDQDKGFTRLKSKGIKTIQCIKTIPDYILSTYPQSIAEDGTTDSRRTDRNAEAAYHKYKGNLVEYPHQKAFPKNGETAKLTFLLNSGDEPFMFPHSLNEPTYFIAKDSQLVYKWNGSKYELLTENIPGVYFEIYTKANADSANPVGKLRTKYNDLCTADRNNPQSYIDFAKIAFQSAARYGNKKAIDLDLVLTPDKKTGLNLIEGFEAGNELNAHWHGRRRYLTPYEQAALLSAVYDGHMGTMGPGVGVKNADPNLKVYNGGIVSASPAFFRAMIDWCEKNRGYLADGSINICWDAQKYHQYTNSNGLEQHTSGERYAMPADMVPVATARIAKIKKMNYELLGRPMDVHIGEWGYDIGGSKQGAKAITNKKTGVKRSSRQTAGDWIIRDQLEYCWYGIDAMQLYLLEDPSPYEGTPEDNSNLYATSGLFNRGDKAPSRAPRPAAWYSRQLMESFGEYTPVERLSEDPRVQKHKDSRGNTMYALWIPDMIGRKENYTLELPGISTIKILTLVEGSEKMKEEEVEIDGSHTLSVGETPIFIMVPAKKKSGSAINISIEFSTTPQSASTAFADLKYDKQGVFNYEQDDVSDGIYKNLFMFLEGGTAEDGKTYPGKTFTDGCGNPINYKAAAAIYTFDKNGKDVHIKTPGHLLWKDMKTMIEKGWSIENHGLGGAHNPDRWLELHKHAKYIYDKMKEQGIEVRPRVFVVPGNSKAYVDAAFNTQHKIVTSQSTFDGYRTQHPVADIEKLNLNKLMLQRRFLESIPYSKADEWVDEFFASIDGGQKSIFRAFSHNIQISPGSFGLIKHVFNRIDNLANDRIWVTTAQDFYEYLETKRDVIKKEELAGNKLYIELDLSNISDLNRFSDMTLLIKSDAKIKNIEVENADSSSFNIETGLLNVYLENKRFPDPALDKPPPLLIDALVKPNDPNQIHLSFNKPVNHSSAEGYQIEGTEIVGIEGKNKSWVLQLKNPIQNAERLTLNYTMRLGTAVDVKDKGSLLNSYIRFPVRNRLNATPDNTPPTTPTNLRHRKLTSKGFELTWDASDDNKNVKGYYIEEDGIWGNILCENTALYFHKEPATTSRFRVKAVDDNFNYSAPSPYLNVETLSEADYQILKTVKVTFGGQKKNSDLGWNVLSEGDKIFESEKLKETDGRFLTKETDITISTLKPFENVSGSQPSSGNNSGLFPDGVVNSIWRTSKSEGNTPFLSINNLSPHKFYNLYILGNVSGKNTSAIYIVNNEKKSKKIDHNYPTESPNPDRPWLSPALVSFIGKKPDNNGKIFIDIDKGDAGYWVGINALIIEETNKPKTP